MPARKSSPTRKRHRGTQQELNKTLVRAVVDLQKRIDKLEKKKRREIGFGAELHGIAIEEPDLDEIANETIT
jgi:hypothetical protein